MIPDRPQGRAPDRAPAPPPERAPAAAVPAQGAAAVPAQGAGPVSGPAGREPEPGTAAALFRRWLSGVLRGLFRDLVRDAFVPRPLPPARRLPPTARGVRALPAPVREALRWAPHAGVVALTVLVALLQALSGVPAADAAAGRILVPLALLTALCRPVLSGWLLLALLGLSLARPGGVAAPFTFAELSEGVFQYESQARPWAWAGLLAFAALQVVLGLRLGLRAALGFWALVLMLAAGLFGPYVLGTSVMALLSGGMPLVCAVVTGWRRAREEAAVHAAATAEERSRRILLEERAVIARELHDVVAHHMSVVAIQAQAAPFRVEAPPPELERAFAAIRENAVAALAELRRVLGAVRAEPAGGDGVTAGAAEAPQPGLADLAVLLERVRATGVPVEETVRGAVRELPRGVELSAYRIVQEALSNALRHAPGSPVRVELDHAREGLGVTVVNGPATELATEPGTGRTPRETGAGHGLTGMRERVAMLGGRLEVRPTDGGGFEVSAFLPAAGTGEPDG
ncbi:histidine kinase [Streptomyces sp. WMMB 714]|uniref:histidine kinase n=1 Tax=Streptomyces sp. WMMB 714 TaxID=1286822 RepID=UPI0006991996|nr:histidine kinase [Streptomyces sp. WMMB 714]